VTRVVEQRVKTAFSPGSPAVDAFLCEWAPSVDALAPVTVPSYVVSEYRQRDPQG
jgi:hypothetical protein